MNRPRFKLGIVLTLLQGAVFSVAGIAVTRFYLHDWRLVNERLHSVAESLGTFAALLLAVFLLSLRRQKGNAAYPACLSAAFMSMGILDGLHAVVPPGDSFVWLRSLSTLFGGFLFAMVSFRNRPANSWLANACPMVAAVAATTFGIFSIVFHEALPVMANGDGFTPTAHTINLVGGLFFVVATAHFLIRYRRNGGWEDLIFANLCFLFALAGVLVSFSLAWEADWWFWHALRLIAYVIALWYVFAVFEGMQGDLSASNESLRQNVEELRWANQRILEQQTSVIEEERLKVLLQMAGATAHEMNQPLAGLLGTIELMKIQRDNPEQLARHVSTIEEAADRISGIVKKIQDIRRSDTSPHVDKAWTGSLDENLHILSVEDTHDDFEKIRSMLEKHTSVRLSRVTTVEEAIRSLESNHIDLVLLDHVLPDGNSLDVLNGIEERGLAVPVVLITGKGDEMVASRAIQAGALDYLPKEFVNEKSLIRSIHNALEKSRLKRDMKLAMQKLADMAAKDELTGLYNRRYFVEMLEREMARARRTGQNLVVSIMDLDHFKRVNDSYGHAAGDMVLSEVGKILQESMRLSDLVCRYGGEEFAVILPGVPADSARRACERFREHVSGHQFVHNSSAFRITVSIGIAPYDPSVHNSPADLVQAADEALYEAKDKGRNRVEERTAEISNGR